MMKKLAIAAGLSTALYAGCSSPETPQASTFPSITQNLPATSTQAVPGTDGKRIAVRPLHGDLSIFEYPDYTTPLPKSLAKGDVVDGVCIVPNQGFDSEETKHNTMLRIEGHGQALGYIGMYGGLDSGKDQPYTDWLTVPYNDLVAQLPECGAIATNPTEL